MCPAKIKSFMWAYLFVDTWWLCCGSVKYEIWWSSMYKSPAIVDTGLSRLTNCVTIHCFGTNSWRLVGFGLIFLIDLWPTSIGASFQINFLFTYFYTAEFGPSFPKVYIIFPPILIGWFFRKKLLFTQPSNTQLTFVTFWFVVSGVRPNWSTTIFYYNHQKMFITAWSPFSFCIRFKTKRQRCP